MFPRSNRASTATLSPLSRGSVASNNNNTNTNNNSKKNSSSAPSSTAGTGGGGGGGGGVGVAGFAGPARFTSTVDSPDTLRNVPTYVPKYISEKEAHDKMTRWKRISVKTSDDAAGHVKTSDAPDAGATAGTGMTSSSSTDKGVKSRVFGNASKMGALSSSSSPSSSRKGFTEEELEKQYEALSCVWKRVENTSPSSSPPNSQGVNTLTRAQTPNVFNNTSVSNRPASSASSQQRNVFSSVATTPSRPTLRPLSRSALTPTPTPSNGAGGTNKGLGRAGSPPKPLPSSSAHTALFTNAPEPPMLRKEDVLRSPEETVRRLQEEAAFGASGGSFMLSDVPFAKGYDSEKKRAAAKKAMRDRWVKKKETAPGHAPILVSDTPMRGGLQRAWPSVEVQLAPFTASVPASGAPPALRQAGATSASPSAALSSSVANASHAPSRAGLKQSSNSYKYNPNHFADSSSDDDGDGEDGTGKRRRNRVSPTTAAVVKELDAFEAFHQTTMLPANYNKVTQVDGVSIFQHVGSFANAEDDGYDSGGGGSGVTSPISSSFRAVALGLGTSKEFVGSGNNNTTNGPKDGAPPPPTTIVFDDSSDEEYFTERQHVKEVIVQEHIENRLANLNAMIATGAIPGGFGSGGGALGGPSHAAMVASTVIGRRPKPAPTAANSKGKAGGTVTPPALLPPQQSYSELNEPRFAVLERKIIANHLQNHQHSNRNESGGGGGNSPTANSSFAVLNSNHQLLQNALSTSQRRSTVGGNNGGRPSLLAGGTADVISRRLSVAAGASTTNNNINTSVEGGGAGGSSSNPVLGKEGWVKAKKAVGFQKENSMRKGGGAGNDTANTDTNSTLPQFFASDAVDILRELYRTACATHQDREDAYVQTLGGLSFPMTFRKFKELVRRLVEGASGGNAVVALQGSFKGKPNGGGGNADFIYASALAGGLIAPSSGSGANATNPSSPSNNASFAGNATNPDADNSNGADPNSTTQGNATTASFRAIRQSVTAAMANMAKVGGGVTTSGDSYEVQTLGNSNGGGKRRSVSVTNTSTSNTTKDKDSSRVVLVIPDDVYRAMYTFIVEKVQSLPSVPKISAANSLAKQTMGLPIQLTPIIPYVGFLHGVASAYFSPNQLQFTEDLYHHIRNSPHINYYLYHLRHRVLVKMQRRLTRQLKLLKKITSWTNFINASKGVAPLMGAGISGGGGGSISSGASQQQAAFFGGNSIAFPSRSPSNTTSGLGGGSAAVGGSSINPLLLSGMTIAPNGAVVLSTAIAGGGTKKQKIDMRAVEALRRELLPYCTEPAKLLTLSAALEFAMLGDPIEEGAKARLFQQKKAYFLQQRQQMQQQMRLANGGGGGGGDYSPPQDYLSSSSSPMMMNTNGGGTLLSSAMYAKKSEEEILDAALRDIERRLELIQSSAADTFKTSTSSQWSRAGEVKDQLLLSIFLPKKTRGGGGGSNASSKVSSKKNNKGSKVNVRKPQGSSKVLSRRYNPDIEGDEFNYEEEDDDDDDSDDYGSDDGDDDGGSEDYDDSGEGGTSRRARRRAKRREAAASGKAISDSYAPTKFAAFVVRDVVFNLRGVSIQFPHPEEDAFVNAIVQCLASTALDTATALINDEAAQRKKREEELALNARLANQQHTSIAGMIGDEGTCAVSETTAGTAEKNSRMVSIEGEYRPPLHPPPLNYLSLDDFRMLIFCDDKAMQCLEAVCPAEKTLVDGVFSQYRSS